MEFVQNLSKAWKPTKIHKKVKLVKCYKKWKSAAKVIWKPLLKKLSTAAGHLRHSQHFREDDDLAFMTFIIKVNASKPGWQKRVRSVLRNCKGTRFQMDHNGVVEISGIGDPNRLLKKIGKSTRIELQWFQFGQCSSNLFMPEAKKDPPVQEKLNQYNILPSYRGYGYNYQPTQLFNPYAPY